MRLFSCFIPIVLLLSLPVLAGCTPVGVVVGAGATAGSIALEERGFEQGVKDRATEAAIAKQLLDFEFDAFRHINIEVVENRVLLTGVVAQQDHRVEAVKIAWAREGVTDVINEVIVGDAKSLLDSSKDAWIVAQLRTAVTLDEQIKAVNYSFEAVGGIVYLFGIAQNEAEIKRVTAHAREIDSVRRVVSHHMLLKSDPRRVPVSS